MNEQDHRQDSSEQAAQPVLADLETLNAEEIKGGSVSVLLGNSDGSFTVSGGNNRSGGGARVGDTFTTTVIDPVY